MRRRGLLDQDWFGLLAVVAIVAAKPAFLSSYNVQILLVAVAINAVIAVSQMLTIAIAR